MKINPATDPSHPTAAAAKRNFEQVFKSIFHRKNIKPVMKFEYNLSVAECIVSYLLMMGIIIVGLFSGHPWLAFLALPLFLRGLLGWCPLKTMLKK